MIFVVAAAVVRDILFGYTWKCGDVVMCIHPRAFIAPSNKYLKFYSVSWADGGGLLNVFGWADGNQSKRDMTDWHKHGWPWAKQKRKKREQTKVINKNILRVGVVAIAGEMPHALRGLQRKWFSSMRRRKAVVQWEADGGSFSCPRNESCKILGGSTDWMYVSLTNQQKRRAPPSPWQGFLYLARPPSTYVTTVLCLSMYVCRSICTYRQR